MKLRRNPEAHVTVEDGQATVRMDSRVLELSPVASAILAAVPFDDTTTLEAVTDHLVEALGEPPAPRSALDVASEQVHDLLGYEVLWDDSAPRLNVGAGQTTGPAVHALRDALRALLSDPDDRTPWAFPVDVPAVDFLAVMRRHHVDSQVIRGLDQLDLPDDLRSRLRANGAADLVTAERVANDLHRALDALSAAGVRTLSIKGLALAAQAWGDEWARGAGDIDLLVAPADMATAHAAIEGAGWRAQAGYPRPGASWAWRHFMRTDNELAFSGRDSTVDLHFYLVPARSTFPSFDVLWQRRHLVEVAGRPVATLGRYDALAHSSGHAAKDHWRWLRGLLDIHRLIADPDTWRGADRPLRPDQVLSVGLAARIFGVPPGAPEVVRQAVDRTTALWPGVDLAQQRSPYLDAANRVPGTGAWRVVTTHLRTGATPADHARQIASLLLPPSAIAADDSSRAVSALPRALRRRGEELMPLWRKAIIRAMSRTGH